MTDRDRYIQTIKFGNPDRIPYRFGNPRESTLSAWYYQGLKKEVPLYEAVDLDDWRSMKIDFQPIPRFEERTLEEYDDKRIWIDEMGAKRIDHKNPVTPGFVTRSWLDFPVKTRDDFKKMIKRFNSQSPERFGEDLNKYIKQNTERDHVIRLTLHGPFWKVRDWVGFENLCMLCVTEPEFVREMMDFVIEFTIEVLEGKIDQLAIDQIFINEDMAYKTASMISPDMVKNLMVPGYKRLMNFLKCKNVATVVIDCDGHISELIPVWIDVGFDATWPVEIAANNDPVAYRKKFGKDIAFMGTIDKRELRFGFDEVKKEIMSKVPYLIEEGGYIPGVDHGIPPDVPVRNYLYMVELIRAIAEGKSVENVNIDKYFDILGPIKEDWTPELAERVIRQDILE